MGNFSSLCSVSSIPESTASLIGRLSGTRGTTPLDDLVISASLHVVLNWLMETKGLCSCLRPNMLFSIVAALHSVFSSVFCLPVQNYHPRKKGELPGHR